MGKVGYIIEYTPGCDAIKLHRSLAKEILILAPRKSGKSFSLIYDIVVNAWDNDSGNTILVTAPTYSQVEGVLERPIIDILYRLNLMKACNLSKHIITLKNNNTITFRSLEKYDNIRGITAHRVYVDEAAFANEECLAVLKPTLAVTTPTQTKPNALILCTTPNGKRNWFYKKYYAPDAETYKWQERITYTKNNNPYVDEEELLMIRASLDPLMVQQELDAQFIDLSSNRVYYQFGDANISQSEISIDDTYPIHIGVDYNLDIMAFLVMQYKNSQYYVIDECLGLKTVQDLGDALQSRFGNRQFVYLVDDASGHNRNQSDGRTNRQIIRQIIPTINIVAPRVNPPIQKRHGMVNAICLNGLNQRRLLVNKKCKHLIEELNSLSYKKDSDLVDDESGRAGHVTDALGYVINYQSGGVVSQLPTKTNFRN